jgi:Radical SAM superfamily
MRIDLLFTPPWCLSSVIYLALPTLSGYLRQHGVETVQRDINLRICRRLLRRDNLIEARTKIGEILATGRDPDGNPLPDWFLDHARILWAISEYVIENIEHAIETLKAKAEDSLGVDRSRSIIVHACRMICIPYYPTVWSYNNYQYDNRVTSDLGQAIACAFEDRSNVFLDCYRQEIVPEMLASGARTFGLCLAFIEQLVPCLTLARVIKEQAPDATIILGGPLIPYIEEAFHHVDRAFSLVDFIVSGEGEVPLLELLKQLEGPRQFHIVPSLTYRTAEGRCVRTDRCPPIRATDSPLPDFADYDLDQYWIGARSLPYLSARGCYWNKCSFCSINSTYGPVTRQKPVPLVIDELKTLHDKYNCKIFEFSDEAIGPARMRQLSQAILDAGLEIYWFSLARVEKQFTPELLALAYRAGCRVISWGVESGSQRILDLMIKHTRREEALRALRVSHEAGIWNNIFIIIGYPGETEDDFRQSMSFVDEASDWIHSLVYGCFRLEKCTPVFESPTKFGVQIKPYAGSFCRPDYDYVDISGATQDVISRFKRFEDFALGHPGNYYMSLTLGQLISYLSRSPQSRAELRAHQRRRAALHRSVKEMLRSPHQWNIEMSPEVLWKDIEGTVPLRLGMNRESGRVVVLGKKMAEVVQNPEAFRAKLLRCQEMLHDQRERALEFLGVAETTLKSLPFSASPLPVRMEESCLENALYH